MPTPRTLRQALNYLGFLALLFSAKQATAQASAYGMVSLGHYSGLGVGPGTAATQSGGITSLGGTFGLFADFPAPGPIRVGVDTRLIAQNSANSTPYGNKLLAGMVGIRVDGSGLPHTMVIPYGQFEVGGAGTNNGTSYTRTSSFVYQVQFGADFPLVVRQLSGRVEYGTGQLTNAGTTNHTLQTFGGGLVFRFN